ncbi:Zinc finger protein ZPR1, partial [Bienertia sinuspersici]
IPELAFEIPPEAQRGSLSTVEGILTRAADGLEALQEERMKVDPKTAEAIDQFTLKLRACATANSPFTFVLDDPAGNSFIENPFYDRTPEQQATLGYVAESTQAGDLEEGVAGTANQATDQTAREPHGAVGARAGRRAIAQANTAGIFDTICRYTAPEEVMTFPSTCGACAPVIPYFKEVIVMASSCDACGYRNSELKPGGSISDKARRTIVYVKNPKDLNRDVIK